MGNKHKSAVSMAVVSGAGLVLMGLNAQTVSAATNAPANVIRSTNTVTIDGKTYNITQEQYTNNDSDSNTGNETYHPAPVVQDTRPVSDFFDTDDNGNSIVSKVDQQELDAQKAAQQKATDESNVKAAADKAAVAAQQAKDDLAAQQELQQKQAQAEKLVAQQAAAEQAKAQAQQQADIDEADAASVQQETADESDDQATTDEIDQATADSQKAIQDKIADKTAQVKSEAEKSAEAKTHTQADTAIFDKLQKQYENERVTTNLENSKLPQNDDKGPVVYPEKVDKSAGVSAFGKTDRIRGIAAVLNQYYPVINIGDNEGNPDTFGTTTDDTSNDVIYYRQTGEITDTSADKIIKVFEYDRVSGQVIYSNLSKPTASAELIAKYAAFKPEISNDIVAAMIANDGTITYIHRGDKYDTTDAHTQSGPIGLQLAPVYQVDVDNAKADTKSDTQVKPNADVYNKLQKQYQDELATTSNEKVNAIKFDDKGNMVVDPSKVNKSNGVSALGKTDRIRGIAAVLNQYYPVINIGDMVSADNISYGAGMGGYNYYYNDSVILTIDATSKKIVYSNLSKSTASPELIAKYSGFKPVISDDIVAAIIGNDGVISYIHNTGAGAVTTDPNVEFYAPGQWLTPVYQVDVDNAIAADKKAEQAATVAAQKATDEAQGKALAEANAKSASTTAAPKATTEPLKTRAEVQANIAAQKVAAKSAAKAAKKATRKASTATVVPATFAVNDLTQAANSNHVNVSSPVNTIISRSSVANTDNHDNLPKTGVSNDSKTNNLGIFASVLALISAAVLGLKKKFN